MSACGTVVITTINSPTDAVAAIAANRAGWEVVIVGDKATPSDWQCDGASFLSVVDQESLPFAFARACPWNSYTRKNIGYLQAIVNKAPIIVETDDDNHPYPTFLQGLAIELNAPVVQHSGMVNMYRFYTDEYIWPRGFPLEQLQSSFLANIDVTTERAASCPIQQFLADGDPDVDAIYRLLFNKDIRFANGSYILSEKTYCPFNSQNTAWWPVAYPLLYLPSFVNFRVTDIWRSFIAQVVLHAVGYSIAFQGPTVIQHRNSHSLITDFEDELPGYIHNANIMRTLQELSLSSSTNDIPLNITSCYEALVERGIVPAQELVLLGAWLEDLDSSYA